MTLTTVYRINEPVVASQEIEGEAILIHFETGCYYCANATGAYLLALIRRGDPAESFGPSLAGQFGIALDSARNQAGRFVEEMVREGLITTSPGMAVTHHATETPQAPSRYEEPSLQRFDDLQDLLLLDPIHDVDQAGWPMPAPLGPAPSDE